jgi:two-component system, cell cycle sensor histidine kinase and response regulator CckA
MGIAPAIDLSDSVLILAPVEKDAAFFSRVVESGGLATRVCATVEDLVDGIARVSGVAVIAEEVLQLPSFPVVAQAISRQPEWSDLPVLVIGGDGGCPDCLPPYEPLGNFTIIDRPVRSVTFLSAVRAALRSRHRQYDVRTQLSEKAFKESEEFARSVIDSSTDCVEVLDAEGRLLAVNTHGRRLLGMQPDAPPANQQWLDSWTGKDYNTAQNALSTARSGRPARFRSSLRATMEGLRWWDVVVSPIKGPDATASKLLCVSRDITVELQAEAVMREAAKLENLGVMAGSIAHDFNNLLTGIIGNASMVLKSPALKDRGSVEDILLAAERAADLTRQMLAFSGKGRFDFRRIDLSDYARQNLRLIKHSIDKNVEILFDLADAPCFVEGDSSQIQQLIMNLVINAAESMEGKPGRVMISIAAVTADESYLSDLFPNAEIPPGNYISLEVHDTGKGMNEATLARIFEPFFTTKLSGRGLGLAAVSGIVKSHRGALRVRSVVGKGTTFKVLLPASGAPVQKPRPPRPDPGAEGKGMILIVDDEEFIRRIGRTALKHYGYDVVTASDGMHAQQVLQEHQDRVSLILLDITMPVMDGDEALEFFYQIRSDVPVIVCSGHSESDIQDRFANKRVSGFLRKPFSANKLADLVNSVLTR